MGEPRPGIDVRDGVERLSTAAPTVPPAISRQRNAILLALLALAAIGWYIVVQQAGEHDGHMAHGPDLTMGSASLFFTMWVAMMVAMMFPAAAPMIVMFGRMQRSHPARIALFTGSYIALWIAFGGLAFGLGTLVENRAAGSMWVAENWARIGGGLIVLAGVYQLTPIKDVCLRHCRTPLAFVMSHWQDGMGGAVRMGVTHGLYCMGCCWLLFIILVPLGVMNIAAMVAVTLLVFVEKTLPWGRRIGRVAAVGLLAYGGLVIARPSLLPTVV